ncbi:MAG: dephospho-CoA kinase [Thermoanaerobaculales bacterium]|nr:dephospho-CoA kinase [Thermoanaerobaculales bacterium]
MSPAPCTVGLTGGLASGKSTAAEILERLGAEVFDCDAYVHELYLPGGAGSFDVAYLFGEAVLDGEGGVDRGALAALVVGDDEARSRLEGAIHPLVRNGVEEWLATVGPHSVAVIEAALLVETGAWRRYDLLSVIWCRPEQQLDRALARGVPETRARGLLAAQLPMNEKRRMADVAIDNTGSRDDLDRAVERAWREIQERCRERPQSTGPSSHSVW